MRLLMAVSADGFLCRGPDDDMRWTGAIDKRLFRALTLAEPGPLLVGSGTAMPELLGRDVMRLSRSGLTLEDAARRWPDGLLLGGPTVAREAIRAGIVRSWMLSRCRAVLGGGVSASFLEPLPGWYTLDRVPFPGPSGTQEDGVVLEVVRRGP